jgi:mannosyltransferase
MIVLDAIVLAINRYGGIPNYFRELIARVPAARSDTQVWLYEDDHGVPGTPLHVKRQKRRFLERYRSPHGLPAGAIFHSSYYRVPATNNTISIVTVYDFIYERFAPRLARMAHSIQKRHAMERADALISISESTKSDLLEFYPHIPASKVHVVPLAAGSDFFPLDRKPGESANQPYALFVGARGGYKNFAAAAQAVAAVKGMHLLSVGGGVFTRDESALLARILSGRHRHSGYVNGTDLNRLYNEAHCLVYPSLYEGFGIPILEAMAAGCPVITTRRSSMAEIAMESAVLLDDPHPEAIAEAIRLLFDPSTRERYSELGKQNARRFSWDKTILQTLQVYSLLD